MRIETPDFIYIADDPEPPAPVRQGTSRGIAYTEHTFLGMPVPESASPEWFGVRIEARGQPRTAELWRSLIAQVPDERREDVKTYLRARWKVLEDRQRRETVGKRNEAGDAAMAALKQRYGDSCA